MTLTWRYFAREEFANIYARLSVTRQRLVAATMERVEKTLASTPLDVGEGRGDDDRVWTVPPMMVWYRVTGELVVINSVTPSQPGAPDGDDFDSVSDQPAE